MYHIFTNIEYEYIHFDHILSELMSVQHGQWKTGSYCFVLCLSFSICLFKEMQQEYQTIAQSRSLKHQSVLEICLNIHRLQQFLQSLLWESILNRDVSDSNNFWSSYAEIPINEIITWRITLISADLFFSFKKPQTLKRGEPVKWS